MFGYFALVALGALIAETLIHITSAATFDLKGVFDVAISMTIGALAYRWTR